MASPGQEDVKRGISAIWENLQCPICLELMSMPVTTKCDHQFCKFCMQKLLDRGRRQEASCPVCKTKITKRSLQESAVFQRLVTGLQSLVEAYQHDSSTNYFTGQAQTRNPMSDIIDQLTEVESPERAGIRRAEEGGARSMTSSRAAEGFAQLMDFGDSCSVTSDSGLGHLPPVAPVTNLPPVAQETRAADGHLSPTRTLPVLHTPADDTAAVPHTPADETAAPSTREHAPMETHNAQLRLVDRGHVDTPSQEEEEEQEQAEEEEKKEEREAVEEEEEEKKEECERIVVRGKRQTRSARRLLMGEGGEEKKEREEEREEEEEEGEVLRRSSRSRRCLDLGVTGRQKKSLEKVSDWLLKIPLQNAPISQEESQSEGCHAPAAGNDSSSSTDDTSSLNGHMTHQPAKQDQATAAQVGGAKSLEEQVFGRVYGKTPAGPRRRDDSPDDDDTGAEWDTELDVWRTREPGAPWDSGGAEEEEPPAAAAAAEDGQEETPGGDVEQPAGLECGLRQQRKRKRTSQPLTPADFIKRPCSGTEEAEEVEGEQSSLAAAIEAAGESGGPLRGLLQAGGGRNEARDGSLHQSPPITPAGSDPALPQLGPTQVDRSSEAGSEVEVVGCSAADRGLEVEVAEGGSAAEGGSEFEVAPLKAIAARGKRRAAMMQDALTHLQTELNPGVPEKVGRPRRSERPGLEDRESRARPLTLLSAGAEERPLELHACRVPVVAMAMAVDVEIESFPSSCSSPDAHDARTTRRGRKLQDFTREVQGEPRGGGRSRTHSRGHTGLETSRTELDTSNAELALNNNKTEPDLSATAQEHLNKTNDPETIGRTEPELDLNHSKEGEPDQRMETRTETSQPEPVTGTRQPPSQDQNQNQNNPDPETRQPDPTSPAGVVSTSDISKPADCGDDGRHGDDSKVASVDVDTHSKLAGTKKRSRGARVQMAVDPDLLGAGVTKRTRGAKALIPDAHLSSDDVGGNTAAAAAAGITKRTRGARGRTARGAANVEPVAVSDPSGGVDFDLAAFCLVEDIQPQQRVTRRSTRASAAKAVEDANATASAKALEEANTTAAANTLATESHVKGLTGEAGVEVVAPPATVQVATIEHHATMEHLPQTTMPLGTGTGTGTRRSGCPGNPLLSTEAASPPPPRRNCCVYQQQMDDIEEMEIHTHIEETETHTLTPTAAAADAIAEHTRTPSRTPERHAHQRPTDAERTHSLETEVLEKNAEGHTHALTHTRPHTPTAEAHTETLSPELIPSSLTHTPTAAGCSHTHSPHVTDTSLRPHTPQSHTLAPHTHTLSPEVVSSSLTHTTATPATHTHPLTPSFAPHTHPLTPAVVPQTQTLTPALQHPHSQLLLSDTHPLSPSPSSTPLSNTHTPTAALVPQVTPGLLSPAMLLRPLVAPAAQALAAAPMHPGSSLDAAMRPGTSLDAVMVHAGTSLGATVLPCESPAEAVVPFCPSGVSSPHPSRSPSPSNAVGVPPTMVRQDRRRRGRTLENKRKEEEVNKGKEENKEEVEEVQLKLQQDRRGRGRTVVPPGISLDNLVQDRRRGRTQENRTVEPSRPRGTNRKEPQQQQEEKKKEKKDMKKRVETEEKKGMTKEKNEEEEEEEENKKKGDTEEKQEIRKEMNGEEEKEDEVNKEEEEVNDSEVDTELLLQSFRGSRRKSFYLGSSPSLGQPAPPSPHRQPPQQQSQPPATLHTHDAMATRSGAVGSQPEATVPGSGAAAIVMDTPEPEPDTLGVIMDTGEPSALDQSPDAAPDPDSDGFAVLSGGSDLIPPSNPQQGRPPAHTPTQTRQGTPRTPTQLRRDTPRPSGDRVRTPSGAVVPCSSSSLHPLNAASSGHVVPCSSSSNPQLRASGCQTALKTSSGHLVPCSPHPPPPPPHPSTAAAAAAVLPDTQEMAFSCSLLFSDPLSEPLSPSTHTRTRSRSHTRSQSAQRDHTQPLHLASSGYPLPDNSSANSRPRRDRGRPQAATVATSSGHVSRNQTPTSGHLQASNAATRGRPQAPVPIGRHPNDEQGSPELELGSPAPSVVPPPVVAPNSASFESSMTPDGLVPLDWEGPWGHLEQEVGPVTDKRKAGPMRIEDECSSPMSNKEAGSKMMDEEECSPPINSSRKRKGRRAEPMVIEDEEEAGSEVNDEEECSQPIGARKRKARKAGPIIVEEEESVLEEAGPVMSGGSPSPLCGVRKRDARRAATLFTDSSSEEEELPSLQQILSGPRPIRGQILSAPEPMRVQILSAPEPITDKQIPSAPPQPITNLERVLSSAPQPTRGQILSAPEPIRDEGPDSDVEVIPSSLEEQPQAPVRTHCPSEDGRRITAPVHTLWPHQDTRGTVAPVHTHCPSEDRNGTAPLAEEFGGSSQDLFGTPEDDEVPSQVAPAEFSQYSSDIINTQQKVELKAELGRLERMMADVSEALRQKEAGPGAEPTNGVRAAAAEAANGIRPKATSLKSPKLIGSNGAVRLHSTHIPASLAAPHTRSPRPLQLVTPPTTSPRPLQLVLSGLQPAQQVLAKKFAKRMGGSVASQVSSRTTHIIINTDEQLVCERTLKYFQGIAHRKWVLSYFWVSECIKQDKLVHEEEFEVCGDVVSGQSHRGPQRSRLTHQLLFDGVEVCLYGCFTGMTTGQMAEMVELCGGSIVDNPQHFSDTGSPRLIIVQPEVESASALKLSGGALLVSRAWLLDSIGCFSLQDPINYCLQATPPAT